MGFKRMMDKRREDVLSLNRQIMADTAAWGKAKLAKTINRVFASYDVGIVKDLTEAEAVNYVQKVYEFTEEEAKAAVKRIRG